MECEVSSVVGNRADLNGAVVINLWSGPRSMSTSLMYSFKQRSDCHVLDEPLYGHFLKRFDSCHRPYRELVVQSQDTDGFRVMKDQIFGARKPSEKPIRFVKNMAKQLTPDLTAKFYQELKRGKNVLLIRDPVELISSFAEVAIPTLDELCLPHLMSLFHLLKAGEDGRQGGAVGGEGGEDEEAVLYGSPIVLDAGTLRKDPEGTLRALCAALKCRFEPAMLTWQKGPIPEDGVWAPWWYKSIHQSTGFVKQGHSEKQKPFPMKYYPLVEAALPFYEFLLTHAIQPLPKEETSSPKYDLPPPRLGWRRENENILVWVKDRLVPRSHAKISAFDSLCQGGDGVWEGLRVYGTGKVFQLDRHLQRLFDSAKALKFEGVPSREVILSALARTLSANGMTDGVHVRMTLSRGEKSTSGMSPAFNQSGCTLIILPEWKPPVYDNFQGIRLITASTRRNSPQCLDSRIHHNNLLNNILAKIEAITASADDAVMLDLNGFVAETNATNIFLVKGTHVITPLAESCLSGVTRSIVISLVRDELGRENGRSGGDKQCGEVASGRLGEVKENISREKNWDTSGRAVEDLPLTLEERRVTPSELHTADEVFTTGSMGEITPCVEVDGRKVGLEGQVGPVTTRIQIAFRELTKRSDQCWELPLL